MKRPNAVRVPVSRRLLHWRTRLIVSAFWIACVVAVVGLTRMERSQVQALGIVETNDWSIAPVMPARIAEIRTQYMSPVEAGDVLVALDSSSYESQLAVMEADILLSRADLDATVERIRLDSARLKQDVLDEQRQLVVDYEESRLDYLGLLVEVEVDRVKLQQVEADLRRQKELMKEGVVGEAPVEDLSLLRLELQTRIRENSDLASVKEQQVASRKDRLAWADESIEDSSVGARLAPLRANIERQQARVKQLVAQKRDFILTAPISGVVTRIQHRKGEAILAGDSILTISQPASSRVLAYLDENVTSGVKEGSKAAIQAVNGSGARIEGTVTLIGPTVVERPVELLRQQNVLEWGVPVVIALDGEAALRPGQRVRVSILPG